VENRIFRFTHSFHQPNPQLANRIVPLQQQVTDRAVTASSLSVR
jgi:hypothetical protein